MSLTIRGKSRCKLCGELLLDGQDIEGCPAFVWNEADPLRRFNDAGFHRDCFLRDPDSGRVSAVIAEAREKAGPGKRRCAVCSAEVMDHNDYFMLPRLTDDAEQPAYRFNYTHLHKSHVPEWRRYDEALLALRALAPHWRGPALQQLVAELEAARRSER